MQSRNFRLLWFGLFISNAGTWMAATAEGWLVTDLQPGRAAFWLGVISAAFAVPMILLPPIGGAIADRLPRIRLLWIVQIAYLAISAVLAALTLSGAVAIWMLITFAFFNGVILAFDSPVRHAMLPEIVDRAQLTSGISLNSVAFTGAALIGPAIAGLLIPVIGIGGVFAFNAASCVATLVALAKFRDLPASRRRSGPQENVLRAIMGGVRHVRASRTLTGLIAVSTVSGLLARSYGPMLAVFARDVFHVGSGAFGLLVSAGGLGTLIGAFGLAGRADVTRKGRWVMASVLLQGAMLLLFAVSGSIAVALPALLLIGVANAISGALISTLIQLSVPNELRGRVMSFYLLTVVGVPSIGSLLLGAVATATDVRLAVGGGAVLVLLVVAVMFARNGELRGAT